MEKTEIIAKVAKLLALAERGGTLEEAETAMAKVKELLAKYNLEMSEIIGKEPETAGCSEEKVQFNRNMPMYCWYMASAMQLIFDCKVIDHKGWNERELRFIGVGADPIVALQTYTFLIEGMKRDAKRQGIRKADLNSFYIGYATAVYCKAEKIKKQYQAQEAGLVLAKQATIKQYIREAYGRLKIKNASARYSGNAYGAGYDAGQNANFSRGVNNRGGALRLSA